MDTQSKRATAYQMVEGLAQSIPIRPSPHRHSSTTRTRRPLRPSPSARPPHATTILESFIKESGHYQEMAELVERIDGNQDLSSSDWEMIKTSSSHLHDQYSDKPKLTSADREQLSESILDSFGPGRVMFRNTRNALKGFPKRKPVLHPLDLPGEGSSIFEQKIEWLVDWLSKKKKKNLLICQAASSLVEEIYEAVQEQINLKLSQFHEGLNLVQRDRQAAYFADPDGARVYSSVRRLVVKDATSSACIHHLILWDPSRKHRTCGTTNWPARPNWPDRYYSYPYSLH